MTTETDSRDLTAGWIAAQSGKPITHLAFYDSVAIWVKHIDAIANNLTERKEKAIAGTGYLISSMCLDLDTLLNV